MSFLTLRLKKIQKLDNALWAGATESRHSLSYIAWNRGNYNIHERKFCSIYQNYMYMELSTQ